MVESRKELNNGKYIDDQMGNGVPEGGTTGQVLTKASNDDYDTTWGTGSGSGTVTSIATTSPITGGTITTSGTIGITQADSTTDGYLSSTDWNIFNNKLSSIPTLQQVLNTNHDLVNSLNFQGTSAGMGNTGIANINAFGELAAKNNTGYSINAFGYSAAQDNTGHSINAFGFNSAQQNTGYNVNVLGSDSGVRNAGNNVNILGWGAGLNNNYSNVNLFGRNATADASRQTVFCSEVGVDYIKARLSYSLLTSDRKYDLPDASGIIPLTVNGNSADVYGNITIPAGGVTSVGATSPITSSGGTSPVISTSMSTNKLIGRSTAGTGVMEEISIGTGLSLSGGTLSNSSPFTTPLTTKGDIYVRNASADTRLPVGLDTQMLVADSTTTTGLKWTAQPAATPTGYYGAWQDNVTQTAAASNVGYAMIFRTIDLSNGVTVVTNGTNLTRITFANTGIYNLQFSSQFQNSNNQLADVTIWLRLNGTDVAGSSGYASIPNSHGGTDGHSIVSWNYLLSVVAGEYYELIWSTTDHTHVTMQYYAAGSPPPSTASVIATVTQQAGIMAGTGISRGIYSVSTNTTAGSGANVDYVYLVIGSTTITLPTAVGNTNTYTIKRVGTGVVSIATTSSQTIDGSSSPITINVQYVSITVVSDGSNWNII